MTRAWSIRARTALAFALASMALSTAVLVFVNTMTIRSFSGVVGAAEVFGGGAASSAAPLPGSSAASLPPPGHEPAVAPDPTAAAPAGGIAIVSTAAGFQWRWSVVGVVGSGMLAGVVGWAVSRRMLRPVDRITATARRISASTLHERIALGGPDDELRRLSRAIDELLDRLEAAFEGQRRFVAHASHELRTPLAVQRAAIQIGLPDDAGPDDVAAARTELLEQNRRTEHLVESLLVLAEAERGLEGRLGEVDPGRLVDEVVRAVAPRAAERAVAVRVDRAASPGRTIAGEPVLVRQLLANLVDNAVEYNAPGGFVVVTADDAGWAVENSGPTLTPEVVATLTEPFRRATGGGRHSGLGLSIVAAVAAAHGWRLDLTARGDGGLRARVTVDAPGVAPV